MSLLLNALLVLITVGFLAFAGVAVYALILLIRRECVDNTVDCI